MKKNLLSFLLVAGGFSFGQHALAQNSLAPDQNPLFESSKAKYMAIADSVNTWHSTTIHETYKAIDYLEDKKVAREARQEFRRELRLERARRNYYTDRYYMPYDNFNNNNRFRDNNWYRSPGMYRNNFGPAYYRNNNSFLWSTVPLALTFALLCR